MATVSAKKFFGGQAPPPPPPSQTTVLTPDTPPSYIERLRADFAERNEKVRTARQLANKGKQSHASGLFQAVGQVAGAVGDVVTEAVAPVLEKTGIPKKIGESKTVQDAKAKYDGWKAENPEAAANLEAVVNIASILPGPKAAAVAVNAGAKGTKVAATGARSALDLAGQGIQKTGEKIQQSVIRPSTRDISDGFKIENVAKYDLGGTLPQTIAKAHTKLNSLSQELSTRLKGANAALNLNDVVEETARRLAENKGRAFGDNTAIQRVVDQLKAEVVEVAGPNGMVDLTQATNVKRGAGTKGSWAFNRPEPDANAIEKVYTEFYNVLKTQIEKAAPAGIKDLNKQISELIPIQNAALRRLPVEQRNNAISLTDHIGLMSSLFDPKALLIVGASKAAKSGRVGEVLTKTGAALRK